MSKKIDLATVRPSVHRNQAILHPPPAPWYLQRSEFDSNFQKESSDFGGANIYSP